MAPGDTGSNVKMKTAILLTLTAALIAFALCRAFDAIKAESESGRVELVGS